MMKFDSFFFNCSKEYINSIDNDLLAEITSVISKLPQRGTQSEINQDILWLLTHRKWAFDSTPKQLPNFPLQDLDLPNISKNQIKSSNNRFLCKTSTTLNADWHSDFAKMYNRDLVQIEAQFGKVESMFKDFCGFRIASYERRLALGIEIVMSDPMSFFSHRVESISGMAYFDIAKNTLPAIGLECPIWLIGLKVD